MLFASTMRDHTRRGIAYIVGRLAGHPSGAVYDYEIGSWTNIAGDVERDRVNVYDYDRHAHLTGSPSHDGLDLFDHGDRAHVQISLRSSGWCVGFDQATRSHFEVRTRGRDVEVFDFETRRFHAYSV